MKNLEMKIKKIWSRHDLVICMIVCMAIFAPSVMAEGVTSTTPVDNPITVLNNFNNFMFTLIRTVGISILAFCVVQIGMSFKTHDPSQRANAFMGLLGGVIITFSKEILGILIGG